AALAVPQNTIARVGALSQRISLSDGHTNGTVRFRKEAAYSLPFTTWSHDSPTPRNDHSAIASNAASSTAPVTPLRFGLGRVCLRVSRGLGGISSEVMSSLRSSETPASPLDRA